MLVFFYYIYKSIEKDWKTLLFYRISINYSGYGHKLHCLKKKLNLFDVSTYSPDPKEKSRCFKKQKFTF